MSQDGRYQVKRVAEASGVSVRTLHHYDAIGLLCPSARTDAGYRLYSDEDILRLQEILVARELGMALEDIKRMLDDPDFDREATLLAQREALVREHERTSRMIAAVDAALAAIRREDGNDMDMKEIFDGFDPREHQAEAEERWGHTDAYKESTRRTRSYTAEDWKRYKDESDAIMRDAAAALHAGKNPDDAEVMDVAERHRLSIDRWFYPCSKAMHAALADGYEADHRFAENIDRYAEGLTPFWSAAIRANARRCTE